MCLARNNYEFFSPSNNCVICNRTQLEAGSMIVSQTLRGIGFSDKYVGGGSEDKRYVSFPLNHEKSNYIVFWGEVGFWSKGAMKRAKIQYLNSEHPWFCSYCGKRTCSKCGKPLKSPVGSDYITINGECYHSPLLPANPSCINKNCSNFR